MKAGAVTVTVTGALLLSACGGGDEAQRVCASDAGSTACLVDRSDGRIVRLEAEGFQPGSELGVTGLDPGAPDQIGKVAKVGRNGEPEDTFDYRGSGGQIPEMVVTVQGTSRSGAPVLLTLRRPAS